MMALKLLSFSVLLGQPRRLGFVTAAGQSRAGNRPPAPARPCLGRANWLAASRVACYRLVIEAGHPWI